MFNQISLHSRIRDCAADLIRDISDVVFDELVKYKVIKDTTDATQTANADEQMATSESKQHDDYSNIVCVVSNRQRNSYDLVVLVYFICVGIDTGNFISR